MNRRSWLRNSALLGAAAAALPLSAKASSSKAHRPAVYEIDPGWRWEDQPLPPDFVRLLANENPYGPSPKAKAAAANSVGMGNRYGHSSAQELITMLAEKEGVPEEYIQLGPGSNGLLELMAVTQFRAGGKLISADPAYMSLISTALQYAADWEKIKLRGDGAHDLKAMEAAVDADTKMVYICNPNNPTGTLTPATDLRGFCERVGEQTPVFVDEAYIEFLDDPEGNSVVDLVTTKKVIVARTFSKLHGMAGLRIGYLVAQPELLDPIRELIRANMGLCVTSLEAAKASLQDSNFLETCRQLNAKVRNKTFLALKEMGFNPMFSHTSFMLFPIAMEGKQFLEQMRALNIGVRAFSVYGEDHCRVSMGTEPEMDRFLAGIQQVLSKK
jgi:histidinol-phosphate aminotransferase